MGRIARHRLGRGVYHVLNRSLDGRWVLDDARAKRAFLDLAVRFAESERVTVYHWALMSNHYHLAVETLDIATLTRWLGLVQSRFSLWYHRQYGGKGPLWQRRFRSVLVEKSGYLGRLGRYSERNPVRAGICEKPWDYPWSSARAYVAGEPDALITPDAHPFWLSMGATNPERQACFAAWLLDESERHADEKLFHEGPPVIGSKSFLANARQANGRPQARPRGRPRKNENIDATQTP